MDTPLPKSIDRIYGKIEDWTASNWRNVSALICMQIFTAALYLLYVSPFLDEKKLNPIGIYLLFSLEVLLTSVWAYCRYRYRFVKKRKFGVLILSEKQTQDKVNQVLVPLIEELSEEIKEIKFIILNHSSFKTEEGAERFLKKNDYGLKEILFIKANVGKVLGKDEFVMQSGTLCTMDMVTSFRLFDMEIDIKKEVLQRSPDFWGFSMDDELHGTTKVRLSLKDTILYYLGLSSVCHGNPEQALSILKKIFNANDGLINPSEIVDEQLRVKAIKKFYLTSRLAKILSRLCRYNFWQYHKQNRDPKEVVRFLKEYAIMLDGHNDAFNIYVSLARYSYVVGNIDDAILYTDKMAIIDNESQFVHANRGFFAMTRGDAVSLVFHYKALCKYFDALQKSGKRPNFNIEEVVAFLSQYEGKYAEYRTMFRYGIAIMNLYYGDTDKGANMLKDIDKRTEGLKEYKVVNVHVKSLLKKVDNIRKMPQHKRRLSSAA
ncbi:hypothetical protein GCM10027048_44640 [Hymenobacter coalescens]